mgnify:CR=1 FL=1
MKQYRIIVAGCGGMARKWVEYALKREDAEIAALVDISGRAASGMAEAFSLKCPVFTDISAAIRETGANLVFDVTVPESHPQIERASFAAGCDVFGEKPMAVSMEDARAVVKAAEKSGRVYFVMQNRRYNKMIRSFRDIVQSGVIGQPGFACADFFLGPHFGGFRDEMKSPYLLDMAIHTFDQARFISGADPVSVYCHEFNPPGSWYRGNAAAICIFEMSNGMVFCLRASWCAEGKPTSWEGDWRITGSRGTAIWDGSSAPWYEAVDPDAAGGFMRDVKRVEPPMTWNGREEHDGCLDEMFAALAEKRKAETDCTDNIKSIGMVFSALESAAKQQKISI